MIAAEIKSRSEVWMKEPFDEQTRSQVAEMLNNEEELIDSFCRDLDFGTGGLRGILGVGTNRMNIYTVGMASQGFANYLNSVCEKEKWDKKVAVSYDIRHRSSLFALETAKIFAANGFEVFIFTGMMPTPLLSFAVRYKGCCAGVMITASHNPKEYNGYKAYGADGCQLVSPHDNLVIEEVRKITSYDSVKKSGGDELIHYVDSQIETAYLKELSSLKSTAVADRSKKNVKIVYTPLHGTGMSMIPKALRDWGFEDMVAVPEQMLPDGDFPYALSPNPEEQKTMSMAMNLASKVKADIVMATDPDADRIGLAIPDAKCGYVLINGNQTAALLIDYLLRRQGVSIDKNKERYIVKTIVTTELLKDMAESCGVKCYDVLTGFKYIGEVLRQQEGKSVFIGGGEESYGYLAADFVRDKDAVMVACIVAEMVAEAKQNGVSVHKLLENIYKRYGLYVESLSSLTKKGVSGREEIKQMMSDFRKKSPSEIGGEKIVEIRDYLGGYNGLPSSDVIQFFTEEGGKVTVRPSGTEPKIKFYFGVKAPWQEGKSIEDQKMVLNNRIQNFKEYLGIS